MAYNGPNGIVGKIGWCQIVVTLFSATFFSGKLIVIIVIVFSEAIDGELLW